MAYNVLMIIGVVLQLIGITVYCFGSFRRDDVYRVAGGGVGFPDVLGEIPAVGVPCAVLLDGQGAGGNILCRVPGDEPEAGMVGALAVAACDLQVAPVEEAVAGGDDAVFRHHLGGAAPPGVVQVSAACHAEAACGGG